MFIQLAMPNMTTFTLMLKTIPYIIRKRTIFSPKKEFVILFIKQRNNEEPL